MCVGGFVCARAADLFGRRVGRRRTGDRAILVGRWRDILATGANAAIVRRRCSHPVMAAGGAGGRAAESTADEGAHGCTALRVPRHCRWLAVCDLEANCLKDRVIFPQEIVEFPIVLVDVCGKVAEVHAERRYYVRPRYLQLTPFCTELTKITKDTIEAEGIGFVHAMELLEAFLDSNGCTVDNTIVVTCGNWDLSKALPHQCAVEEVQVPPIFQRWVNIKDVYRRAVSVKRAPGMKGMLSSLGLPLVGQHHSGLDDSRNIATIAVELTKLLGRSVWTKEDLCNSRESRGPERLGAGDAAKLASLRETKQYPSRRAVV